MIFEADFVESYDRESIISELRRLARVLGKSTLSRRDIDSHARLSSGVVIKRFGSLRRALQEAELRPTRFMKATDEELCSVLIELWTLTLEKHGRSPMRRELRDYGFPVSGDTYIRRFGSWKRALLAAAQSVSAEASEPAAMPETVPATERNRKSLSVRRRFFVFKRDRYRCRICGASGVELELDHRVPVGQGGSDALDNLQTLCRECNRGKRDSLE